MKNVLKLAFGTALFFSAWASAHVGLTSSSPEDGATLSESPTEITMNFSGDVRLAKIMLHSDDGKMHPLDFSMSMTPKAAYEIAVKNNLALVVIRFIGRQWVGTVIKYRVILALR